MVKRIVSLYLDSEIVERHKIARNNLSNLCNQFLKDYFEDMEEEKIDYQKKAQVLKAKLAEVKSKLEAQETKEKQTKEQDKKNKFKSMLKRLRELNKDRDSSSGVASDEFKSLFDQICEEYQLSRNELVKRL